MKVVTIHSQALCEVPNCQTQRQFFMSFARILSTNSDKDKEYGKN